MSVVGTNFGVTQSLNGLQTTTVATAPAAGIYNVNVQLQLPLARDNSTSTASSIVTVINKNGSASITGTAGASGAQGNITCATGDTISVGLSSANSVDTGLNAVTGTCNVSVII